MRFWLFQANPDDYRLVNRVRPDKGECWPVRQYRDEMKAGDKVILWQSGKDAGVYAFGELAGTPYECRGSRDGGRTERRVDIRYNGLLRQPIFKTDIAEHRLLRNMRVLERAYDKNPFRVQRDEWQALQKWTRDTVNIFTSYTQEENRFTNGLVALLQLSKIDGHRWSGGFFRELFCLEPKGKIECFCAFRHNHGTADAELCGSDCCIRIETKIRSATLRADQVANHLDWLSCSPKTIKTLVLLTPDDSESNYIKRFLSNQCIKRFCAKNRHHKMLHLEWRQLFDHLRHSIHDNKSVFSGLVAQFLDEIRDRIFEQDFAGVIQKIAFGDESEVYHTTTAEHVCYLDQMKRWDRWHTPRKYEKLDGTGRKLMLYDNRRKEITVEVEIDEVKKTKRSSYPWRNSFAPNTLRVFSKPIPVSVVSHK